MRALILVAGLAMALSACATSGGYHYGGQRFASYEE